MRLSVNKQEGNVEKSENIMLSIIIPVYNHEAYIEKAIRSVLMQKVNFQYEVLIGEDCSTDASRKVLKKLENELPSNYYIFYREKNLNNENIADLKKRTRGKYLAVLEGDDFWIYQYKLQWQIDFLENHPDYIAVAHNVEVIDKNENKRYDFDYPECKYEEYNLYDFGKGILPGQTASIVQRNNSHGEIYKDTLKHPNSYPGDRHKAFMLAANGRVYCIQEKWSAYRYVTEGGSSWCANPIPKEVSYPEELKYLKELYEYSVQELETKDSIKVSESLYLFTLLCSIRWGKKIRSSFVDWIKAFLNAKYKIYATIFILRKIVKKLGLNI